VKSDVQISNLW